MIENSPFWAKPEIHQMNTMEEGVFYWNLVHQFIEDYYEEYLPEEEEARDRKIHEIAETI